MTKSREEKWKGWPKTAPSAPSSFDDKTRIIHQTAWLAQRASHTGNHVAAESLSFDKQHLLDIGYDESEIHLISIRLDSAIAEPCQRLGCRFDVAQSMLDRAKEYGELSEEERRAMTNPESATRDVVALPMLWHVVDKRGQPVTWLTPTRMDPAQHANPEHDLNAADNANLDGFPHRWEALYRLPQGVTALAPEEREPKA